MAEWRSWQIAAALMRCGEPDLVPVHTRPGGGLYDCLTLVDPHGLTRVDINRNGSIHLLNGDLIPNWTTRMRTDAYALISEIGENALERMLPVDQPVGTMTQHAVDTVAYALRGGGAAIPIWDPHDYVDDPINHRALDAYSDVWPDLRRNWEQLGPPPLAPSPIAWVWAIEFDGEASRLINVCTGELWRADGSILGLSWSAGGSARPLSLARRRSLGMRPSPMSPPHGTDREPLTHPADEYQ